MVENACLPEQVVDDQFIIILHQRVDLSELNTWHLVECVLLKVVVLEVRVHIETRSSKVVSP